MKLKDIRISRLLSIGMGIILLFVILLGAVALNNAFKLWANTKDLYNHPFVVQRTIGKIRDDIQSIRLEMKELMLEKDNREIPSRIGAVNTYESDIFRMLDVLDGSYLGPKNDIEGARSAVLAWKPVRDETVRLLLAGQLSEAEQSVTFDGTGGIQAQKVMDALDVIDRFALNKAAEFYKMAEQQKNIHVIQLAFTFGIIFLLSMGIIFVLKKMILTPLNELTLVTNEFQQGKLEARSRYESANDFGRLSNAFNLMLETVQAEMRNRDNVTALSAAMMLQEDLHGFCREMLMALVSRTGSQMGAVYLLNGQKNEFALLESIGLQTSARTTFSAEGREGEFGLALVTKQIQRLTDIPAETLFTYCSVSGELLPREIWTMPVLNGDEVIAMVSLASIRSYPVSTERLMKDIWDVLNARMNSALSFRQIREFSEKLQSTNTELDAQAKELSLQADALIEQNIELEMQKKMLDESDKLKSTFLSNMSHELRTPLNSVISLTSVLNRKLRGVIPDDEHSYLEVIERNGRLLLSLVNDILDISRIEAGKEELSIAWFSMRELVDDVMDMISPQAREKGILLKNHVSATLPDIGSDLSMCRHILQNLMGNAVKFTDAGGVEICAMLTHEYMQVSVSDSGIGIAPGQIRFIFDEFRQADDSASRKYGGTGLGLAIARKYARLLHGDIAVMSSPGKGSTFMLRLPLNARLPEKEGKVRTLADTDTVTPEPDDIHDRSPTVFPASGENRTLLLVEDSEPAIIQMKDILSEQGYRVLVARNGCEALENVEKEVPDAMILDLMMPGVDGFQVLKAIRGVAKTAEIPVLILTAKHVTREELSFLKGNHIFQLIQKGSVGRTELLTAIGSMARQKHEMTGESVSMRGEDTVRGVCHDGKQADDTREMQPEEIYSHRGRKSRMPLSGKPLVLVVEDNLDNLVTVKALLDESCEIIGAADGQAGIDKAKEHNPAMILLDISLPVKDGFEVLAEIRRDEALRHIPVVALTARAMKGDREDILSRGFDGYVSKPIDATLLNQAMKGIFHGEQAD